uniref:Uncharacterized protein n=1 Tax=Davidia involucrata TaxID=16924 RepID=A0A5B7BG56_DAVIN
MGFLIFAVKCLDVLAWPVLALGYPLCASIRAIETNSNSDMQKLITYWILFSFISLFELGFVKLIEWLSFWPYLKLLATCLLVLPHFNGAYHVYELLVSPCFSVSPQGVINKFNKPKEELSLKKEDFLAVAERYLKENGPEALEKLIAKESKGAKPNDDVEVIKAVANTEKKEVASAIEMDCRDTLAVGKGLKCKEPNVAQEHIKPVELAEKNAAAAANQAKDAGPNLDQTEKKTAAAAEIKEMRAESAPGGENKPPEITPQKVQKEWTCAICQVTTTAENVLKSHFQGKKHGAKCEELKASKRAEKNKGSSSSAANKGPNQNETKKQKEKVQVTGTSEQQGKQKNVKNTNTGMKQSVLWCSICNVRCPGEIAMASHLSGKKHLSRIQDLLSVGGCANA